eukprot:g65345.t1
MKNSRSRVELLLSARVVDNLIGGDVARAFAIVARRLLAIHSVEKTGGQNLTIADVIMGEYGEYSPLSQKLMARVVKEAHKRSKLMEKMLPLQTKPLIPKRVRN